MMKIFKHNDLTNYEFFFSKPYNYTEKKYNLKCLIKQNDENNMIILQTPKMKIESNLSSGYLVFSFFNNKKHNKLLDFIKNIEDETSKVIKDNFKKKLILHSNITNDKKFIVNINNTILPIFNNKNNSIDFNSVDINSDFICIMKLQGIWIDLNKKKFGLNWYICQIKVYPELDYSICYIEDSDDENNDERKIVNEFVVQKCLFCNSECTFQNNITNIIKGKGKGFGKGQFKGKGKGVSPTTNNNLSPTKNATGRGDNKVEVKKKDEPRVFLPSVDELKDMKLKLKKMIKISSEDD